MAKPPPPSLYSSAFYQSLQASTIKTNNLIANVTLDLPAPLQSIANLTTSGNEILYTQSTNNYAVSGISSIGRSFLTLESTNNQRSALGLVIGTDVQQHSNFLDDIITIGSTNSNIVVSTGSGFTNSSITLYARNNLLTATSNSQLATLLGSITGTLTTTDRLVKITDTNELSQTDIILDDSNNLSGINDISLTGTLGGITVDERTQLSNINSTTISSTQWEYLGTLDQSLNTTDSVAFSGINLNNQKITNVLNPSNDQDAATKSYVDSIASTGAPPLESVNLATSTILPNTPSYASPAQTLTSTGGPGSLSVDGVAVSVGDRILVKDQGTNTQNGIYVVTDDGSSPGPNWVLTRSSDFNQAAMPLLAGASIFVQLGTGGSVNTGTTWALQTTINNIDPLTDPVIFVQIGGVQNFSAGSGIDSIALSGGTIQTDISARLKYSGNTIDLNTITVPYGGTGLTTLTSNGVMIGQGTSSIDTTKLAPTGDFVGTSDTQTLTNKTMTSNTNNIISRALYTDNGDNSVSTYASSNPTNGQFLIATSSNTATWQTFTGTEFDRSIRVYQSGPNTGLAYNNITDAITHASTLTPLASNPVTIIVYPGTYSESTPLIIPAYVNIQGFGPRGSVIIRPTAPAPIGAVVQLGGNVNLANLIIDGNDGSGGYSTIGINSSIGTAFSQDSLNTVTIRNCSSDGIILSGNGSFGSKIMIIDNVSVLITASSFTMTYGINVNQGAILSGVDLSISGFLGGGSTLSNGLYVHDDFSYVDLYSIQISSATNAIVVGSGVNTTSRNNYPNCRILGAKIGLISNIAISLLQKSVTRFSDLIIDDDTNIFPNQIHISTNNPSLPSDPNLIVFLSTNLRFDLFSSTGATNNIIEIRGTNLSETLGEYQTQVYGELSIGTPGGYGAELSCGEGDSRTIGMVVLIDDGGVFTNITNNVKFNSLNNFSTNLATTGSINLTSAPATIDGITPTSGVTRVLVKDGSTANPGSSSIDNGIYLWNGTGSAMTRTSDFAATFTFSSDTGISVQSGTVNYGSRWKLNTDITIGTTSFSLLSSSSLSFPSSPTNNDALYIGNTLYSFPGIKATFSSPITTTSSLIETNNVITWEYWNGSIWTALPLMSTLGDAPYTVNGLNTFAFNDTITNPNNKSYQYRFGRIESSWATTTINGTLAYWIRARVINAANIVQIPVAVQFKISTDHTEINRNGFIEYFGDARPVQDTQVYLSALNPTGASGEFSPDSQTITAANTGSISITSTLPNSRWRNTRNTAISFVYVPHKLLDSSLNLKLKFDFNNGITAGPANIALKVDYAFLSKNNNIILGTTASTLTPDVARTTGWVAYAVATSANGFFPIEIPLNIVGLKNNEDINTQTVWIKINRNVSSSGGLDTYGDSVYLQAFHMENGIWCPGGYYE